MLPHVLHHYTYSCCPLPEGLLKIWSLFGACRVWFLVHWVGECRSICPRPFSTPPFDDRNKKGKEKREKKLYTTSTLLCSSGATVHGMHKPKILGMLSSKYPVRMACTGAPRFDGPLWTSSKCLGNDLVKRFIDYVLRVRTFILRPVEKTQKRNSVPWLQ